MGVRNLLKFISTNCPTDTNHTNNSSPISSCRFSDLSGKTIVVDASIYMYKYKQDKTLMESMYRIVITLRYHNVTPVFIFDGKPGIEKDATVQHRRNVREKSRNDHMSLQDTHQDIVARRTAAKAERYVNLDLIAEFDRDIAKLDPKLEQLRRSGVSLKRHDFVSVKALFDSMGVIHITPDHEADPLCVKMVNSNIAYACLTEDTDMFVYGCQRVLRSIDLYNMTFTIYHTNRILATMEMPLDVLRTMCFLAGTDYCFDAAAGRPSKKQMDLSRMYKKYIGLKNKEEFSQFADSVLDKNDQTLDGFEELYQYNHCDTSDYKRLCRESRYDEIGTRHIMQDYGFVFVN